MESHNKVIIGVIVAAVLIVPAMVGIIGLAIFLFVMPGSCPDPPKVALVDGSYATFKKLETPYAGYKPYALATGRQVLVDRKTGTVVVSYELSDGRRVEETWKMGPVRWSLD